MLFASRPNKTLTHPRSILRNPYIIVKTMPRKKPISAALAKQKAAKKAKVEKKAEKRDTKKKGPVDEDEDLDAVLAKVRRIFLSYKLWYDRSYQLFQLAKDWETKHKVDEETVAGPPSQRANASLTPCPTGNHLW